MNCVNMLIAAAGLSMLTAAGARADVRELIFAEPGTTYTGFQFPNHPATGGRVTLTRIYLYLHVFPGADARDFNTDLAMPIQPDEGATNIFVFTGTDLGWSGSGTFTHVEETTRFNGTIISTLFGAETATLDAEILEGSRIELVYEPSRPRTDLDGDGQVGLSDLAILLSDFGCSEVPCAGDVDDDGDTDLADLAELLGDFGT